MFEKPQNVKINSGGYRVYVMPFPAIIAWHMALTLPSIRSLNSYIVLGVTIKRRSCPSLPWPRD